MNPKRRAIDADSREDAKSRQNPNAPAPPTQLFQPTDPFAIRHLQTTASSRPHKGQGRRSQTRSERRGHYVRAIPPNGPIRDLALDATLRAAAPYQKARREVKKGRVVTPVCLTGGTSLSYQVSNNRGIPNGISGSLPATLSGRTSKEGCITGETILSAGGTSPPAAVSRLQIRPSDLRVKERRRRIGNLILFVVDASGSMAAKRRMEAVKGAVLSLLLDAYQKRDRVGMIAFRGKQAELLLPPTNSIDLAERALRKMPTGGRTPLPHALTLAHDTLRKAARGDEQLIPLLVLVSDGRVNIGLAGNPRQDTQQAAAALAKRRVASLVLDSEQGYVRLGLARNVARWLNGEYLKLDGLHADAVRGAVTMMIK